MTETMLRIVISLLSLMLTILFLVGCQQKQTEEKDLVQEVVTIDLPKPLHIYESEGIALKSFDFDRLEPYLNQKNDTVYVVNFWATWCVPCVEELPHFEKLNAEYKERDFKMLLVSLDFPKMAESRVIPFIKEKDLKAEVVLLNDPDANRWIEKVSKDWSGAIPATLIYKNNIREFYEKTFTDDELASEIQKFINL
ncbi:MAG: TlpA disulfide reductase family protein [Flavobacteriaceae bacterium]|jgi:thiol-disulfide isomerase/thioredoxin|nr:TlpA disulfide reductase family protein [Flavobacteriaceae bacterium]